MEKRLLSAKEAGQYLGISHRTAWAWAQQGLITFVRLRRRILFDRVDLDKMIEDCTEWSEGEGQNEE